MVEISCSPQGFILNGSLEGETMTSYGESIASYLHDECPKKSTLGISIIES